MNTEAQQRLADRGQGGGSDGFRLDEWNALPNVCLFAGCENGDIDERGPIWLRGGSMRKACTEHWEPTMRVLGDQASWERTDAFRPEEQS